MGRLTEMSIDNDKIIEVMAKAHWLATEFAVWEQVNEHAKKHAFDCMRAVLTALSSSGYIICQAGDAETDTGSAATPFQFIAFAEAAMVPALLAAAKYGLPPDVQELLIHGNATRGIPSGILIHMLRAAATAPGQLEEAQADTATEDAR